jgi:hypothetical protein
LVYTALVFFLSAAILGLQVSLVRIFSVVFWYHFGFMIVSLAMLGFALAGLAVRLRKARKGLEPTRPAHHALLGAAIVLPAVIALTRVPVDPTLLLDAASHKLLFVLVILLSTLPFCLWGYAFCAALELGRESINRVYGASFLGGALGVGLALLGMEYLGGSGGVVLSAGAAWISGCVLIKAARSVKISAAASLIVIVACLIQPSGIVPDGSQKHFPAVPPEQIIDRKWNAFSSVIFYENPDRHGLWAMASGYGGPLPEMIGIAIDEWAITSIIRFDGDLERLGFFEAYPPTLGLETAEPGFDALVIGAGGGLDVLGALYYGAGHVNAVELNPLIVDAVKGRFSDYSGNLYQHEKVTAVASEGRHFVDRDRSLYDRIILTGVDTFAATAAGAYALSENYIYTREAFQAYLARLEPGGMLMMTRWFYMPPRQTLRLISAAREALVLEGVEDPDTCFFLARARLRSLILIKKEPFSTEETTRLFEGCADREAQLIHARGYRGLPEVDRFFTEKGRAEMFADYPYRVDAPTDDCPFLFEHTRWSRLFAAEQDWFMGNLGGLEVLFLTFLALIVFLALGMAGLIGIDRLLFCRRAEAAPESTALSRSGRILLALAFLVIGLGYLAAEAVMLPKLVLPLGHPVYAMSLVLVSLLVFSGLGSICSRRLPATGSWAAASCAAAAASLPLLFQGVFGLISDTLLHASMALKMALLWALMAVPGFLMGIPFPLAIRVFGNRDEALVPRAFLWNGVGSALAAPLATGLAITVGFDRTLWIAAIGYVLVGFLLAGASARIGTKR